MYCSWWIWPSWLRRQIVVLKIVGSIPTIHPTILEVPSTSFLFFARVAELADAPDSKSGGRKIVWVQVPSLAPQNLLLLQSFIFHKFVII